MDESTQKVTLNNLKGKILNCLYNTPWHFCVMVISILKPNADAKQFNESTRNDLLELATVELSRCDDLNQLKTFMEILEGAVAVKSQNNLASDDEARVSGAE
jgi:hypothetical protein